MTRDRIIARNLVAGDWLGGAAGEIVNPYDGNVVGKCHLADAFMAAEAARAAASAWRDWRRVPAFERADLLHRVSSLITEHRGDLAELVTLQTGKIIADSLVEADRSAWIMKVSAEEALRVAGEVVPMDVLPAGVRRLGFSVWCPIGSVLAISSFNAPLSIVCHKLGPALAAGNCVVLKPHPAGSGVATRLAEICLGAGLPAGVFNVLQGGADVAGVLIGHPDIVLVNFTGSGATAAEVIRAAGLKRTLMELGGNAPTIVHHDADLAKAAADCVAASFALSGQSCVSTQRLYVHRAVMNAFLDEFRVRTESLVTGDPLDPRTEFGPLVNEEAAIRVESWINEAIGHGARRLTGGPRRGAFLPPTLLAEVPSGMRVACEEVFGPVAIVQSYDDIDEAFQMANDTPWGLKAGLFTNSLEIALRGIRALEYGTVNINAASRSRLDHEPSGGTKLSGWGKEGPRHAIREMSYLKFVNVQEVMHG